jgi:pantoate--beta-alanine ligase
MVQFEDIGPLRARIAQWRAQGQRIAFVPTMGNLHAGHYSLVTQARREADRVVASVFVNPTQFGPQEDLARYPRTLAADAAGLASHGCDLLFAPGVAQMYPHGTSGRVEIRVPGLEDILCGAFRPGHFGAVATVVARLFGIVQPDVALFGAKDYQQLLVVRRMVEDLALPVRVLAGATVREPDGLALSSRNQYLDAAQRQTAARLYAVLQVQGDALRAGTTSAQVEADGFRTLAEAGFRPDYVAVRAADTLQPVDDAQPHARVILAAAWLGATRLIDNLLI